MESNKINKTIKAIAFVFLGLILWTAIVYMAIAFLKVESNPFLWVERDRGAMVFLVFLYIGFSPLIVIELKNQFD